MTLNLDIDDSCPLPLNPIWSFGANTCNAPLWLRDDLGDQIKKTHEQLGFAYIRAHNVFSDRFDIVQTDGTFDFTRVGLAFDRLLSYGVRPFVELSSLPEAMNESQQWTTAYKFHVGPPRDFDEWYLLVKGLVEFLTKRYGVEELRQWYFEVWNEPDIGFWKGSKCDYFRLYDLAARAVKETDSRYRIGGPATSKTAWIDEFLEHLEEPSADFPFEKAAHCDFIATHAYPSDLAYLPSAYGDVTLLNSNIMLELFGQVRKKVDAALGEDFPIICGEWNSSAGPMAWNHDECNNAPFVVKTMIELADVCQGSLYWNLSDIYEECEFHYEPFHGGYGLFTVNEIPKAAFHAFRLLNNHSGSRLPVRLSEARSGVAAIATQDENRTRLTIAYYREPDENETLPITVRLNRMALKNVEVEIIEAEAGSAYETWLRLGSPDFLNRNVLENLERASHPRTYLHTTLSEIEIKPATVTQLTWES